jgi:alkylation response protein AidB-like acyl-CoA dehydrogenase
MEGLGYRCHDNGLIFGINAQMWSVQAPIQRFGSFRQKERYLPALISSDVIGAHAMSEPGSGSDSFALTTTATRDGPDYVLNGSKTFVSNGPVADFYLVFATVNPQRGFFGISAFLVPRDAPGLAVGAPIQKMGLRTSPMCELFFDRCRIPTESLLGEEGNGGTIFKHSMLWERLCILASHIGTMERQISRAVDHAKARIQFGRPISAFQAVSHRIVDMKVRLESARLLLYRAAWSVDRTDAPALHAAMSKLAIAEASVASSLDAVQVFGGYGYTVEYDAERELRDAVGARLYSGTSEIQRELIARELGL